MCVLLSDYLGMWLNCLNATQLTIGVGDLLCLNRTMALRSGCMEERKVQGSLHQLRGVGKGR